MAERLTKRIEDEATLNGTGDVPCKTICDRMYKYDHPCDMCPINEAINKLAHYEDMEEQGRLIELPCAVGDTVWTIDPDINFIDDFKVTDIDITKEGIGICNHYLGFFCYINDFGKTVFLTKEEAEAKLKELRGEQE